MEKLGIKFREIRKKKKLTLEYVALGITSISMLSKFERGESDIAFSKIIKLLNRLNITLEEFLFISSNYKKTHIKEKVTFIVDNYFNPDVQNISRVIKNEEIHYKKTDDFTSKLSGLMFKAIELDLSGKCLDDKQKNIIINYLWETDYWGEYEFILYGIFLNIMKIDSVIVLSKEVLKKLEVYSECISYRSEIYYIIINTIVYCLEKNRISECEYFLKKINSIKISEIFQYERLLLKYLEGLILIKKGKLNTGKQISLKTIELFEFTNSVNLTNFCVGFLKKILK